MQAVRAKSRERVRERERETARGLAKPVDNMRYAICSGDSQTRLLSPKNVYQITSATNYAAQEAATATSVATTTTTSATFNYISFDFILLPGFR